MGSLLTELIFLKSYGSLSWNTLNCVSHTPEFLDYLRLQSAVRMLVDSSFENFIDEYSDAIGRPLLVPVNFPVFTNGKFREANKEGKYESNYDIDAIVSSIFVPDTFTQPAQIRLVRLQLAHLNNTDVDTLAAEYHSYEGFNPLLRGNGLDHYVTWHQPLRVGEIFVRNSNWSAVTSRTSSTSKVLPNKSFDTLDKE